MANIITNKRVDDKTIQMSNGLTSVFIETICLAGSAIATEAYEKDLMIWFAQRDWVLLGMGFEGFDIAEIVWDKELFDKQKDFILRTIDLTCKKKNWDLVGYTPQHPETGVFKTLSDFQQMITAFEKDNISIESEIGIFDFEGEVKRYEKCTKHGIYKHYQGCVICNNEPTESS